MQFINVFGRQLLAAIICLNLIGFSTSASSETPLTTSDEGSRLPLLGDSVSATISPEKEFRVGRAWLRMLRSKAPIIDDPIVQDFAEHFIYHLASNSELQNPKIEVIIIESPEINAFAVPGGVIGINGGTFLAADNADEMASVLSHELAHLSQRHYARSVEEASKNQWASMAALLATVVLAARGGFDAGMATLATSQAASIQNQLQFSRQNEQEADRIGMQTLVNSGYDPHAMPRFFETLQKTMQYSGFKTPEYLLTHPLTENRIADVKNRAEKYPSPSTTPVDKEFEMVRARLLVGFSADKVGLIKQFQQLISQNEGIQSEIAKYGLAYAYLKNNQIDAALKTAQALLQNDPHRISYIQLLGETEIANNKPDQAASLIKKALESSPDNYPLNTTLSQALIRSKQYSAATEVLQSLSRHRPTDPAVWESLSEAYGDISNIVGVHQAQAEVLFLSGNTDSAIQQLAFAANLAKDNFQLVSKIKYRETEMRVAQQDLRL